MSHALLEENSVSVGRGEHFISLVTYKNLKYRPYKQGQWSSIHSGHCRHIYFPIPAPFSKAGDAHVLVSDMETKVIVKARKQRAMLPSSLVTPQSFLDAHTSIAPGTARMQVVISHPAPLTACLFVSFP